MRSAFSSLFVSVVGASVFLTSCGSGDSLPRESVDGSVTLGGQPVALGTISFLPADPSGTITPIATPIKDGSYSVSRADGPVPGAYRVSISSPQPDTSRPIPKTTNPGEGADSPMKESVPIRYNAKTELKADVTKGGKNRFDFALDAAK